MRWVDRQEEGSMDYQRIEKQTRGKGFSRESKIPCLKRKRQVFSNKHRPDLCFTVMEIASSFALRF